MKVFVYCNIRTRLLSIRAMSGPNRGKVLAHAEKLEMVDVEFRVNQKGRERVVRTGVKNVHAGVVGEIQAAWGLVPTEAGDGLEGLGIRGNFTLMKGRPVWYDPHKVKVFMAGKVACKPVAYAKRVVLDRCKLRATGVR